MNALQERILKYARLGLTDAEIVRVLNRSELYGDVIVTKKYVAECRKANKVD
jgi:hypothetical protein